MPTLTILGSSNAIATPEHDNTHMVLAGADRTVMIDCVSSPLLRLQRAGIAADQVTDLVLTHFHPDHVSGVPLLLMDMWLLGRSATLQIHGLAHTLERAQTMMDLYGWKSWPGFYEVEWKTLPSQELVTVVEAEDFRILGSPVRHLVPTIGLRIEAKASERIVAYSCDTEPTDSVARLAAGAEVLIHEAAGKGMGHSSAEQAGEVARKAEVGRLVLIHYPTHSGNASDLLRAAQQTYPGDVRLAQDFMAFEMD